VSKSSRAKSSPGLPISLEWDTITAEIGFHQAMKILNRESLVATVDSFNAAILFDRPWQQEAEGLVAWVSTRLGQRGAYAGSFAMTDADWNRDFLLFTGEKITTRAARSHIIAEETTRMLNVIKITTGLDSDARTVSEERLAAQIFDKTEITAMTTGIYCCGKCSVSLWRCVSEGGFAKYSSTLCRGAASLAAHRDGTGGWNRFPFYYTLLFLAQADPKLFRQEIKYCAERMQRAKRLLPGKPDTVSQRRLHVINSLSC